MGGVSPFDTDVYFVFPSQSCGRDIVMLDRQFVKPAAAGNCLDNGNRKVQEIRNLSLVQTTDIG